MNKICNLFSEHEVNDLARLAEEAIFGLYSSYFSGVNYEDWLENNLFHESLVMKCAALRFATPSVYQKLLREAAPYFEGSVSGELLIHPIFYLRKSIPERSDQGPFLDGQPHFDRSFNLYAQTFWLALIDIDIETGGLCFFNRDMEPLFDVEWGEKNKYNSSMYREAYASIDPLVVPHVIHPSLRAGSAYTFGSNTLHGATKPKSKTRLSFDFRLLDSANLLTGIDPLDRRLIQEFNKNIALVNAKSLYLFGDMVGVSQYVNEYALNINDISTVNSLYNPSENAKKIHWKDEYSFLRNS